MKKTVIAMILFSFTMVGTLTYIGLKFEESVEEYNVLENDMEEAALIYMDVQKLDLGVGETYEVSINTLYEDKLLETTTVNDDECEGYVIIKKDFSKYECDAYIKCEDYTTADYKKE